MERWHASNAAGDGAKVLETACTIRATVIPAALYDERIKGRESVCGSKAVVKKYLKQERRALRAEWIT